MAWENPVTTWGQAGKTVPVAGDFNRIEGNTQYLKDEVDSHKAEDASTTVKGHVQLSSSTSSTSTSLAATASAVKTVKDEAKAYTDAHEQKAAPHSGHETPAGAQAKAEAAEAAAKAYADQEVADLAGEGRTTETVKGIADALDSIYQIGDIKTTVRTDLGDDWVLCNGSTISLIDYPKLRGILSTTDQPFTSRTIHSTANASTELPLQIVNGYGFYGYSWYADGTYHFRIAISNNVIGSWYLVNPIPGGYGGHETSRDVVFDGQYYMFLVKDYFEHYSEDSSVCLMYTTDPTSTWSRNIMWSTDATGSWNAAIGYVNGNIVVYSTRTNDYRTYIHYATSPTSSFTAKNITSSVPKGTNILSIAYHDDKYLLIKNDGFYYNTNLSGTTWTWKETNVNLGPKIFYNNGIYWTFSNNEFRYTTSLLGTWSSVNGNNQGLLDTVRDVVFDEETNRYYGLGRLVAGLKWAILSKENISDNWTVDIITDTSVETNRYIYHPDYHIVAGPTKIYYADKRTTKLPAPDLPFHTYMKVK